MICTEKAAKSKQAAREWKQANDTKLPSEISSQNSLWILCEFWKTLCKTIKINESSNCLHWWTSVILIQGKRNKETGLALVIWSRCWNPRELSSQLNCSPSQKNTKTKELTVNIHTNQEQKSVLRRRFLSWRKCLWRLEESQWRLFWTLCRNSQASLGYEVTLL